eukprot:COSAG02_NODE_1928_length_10338_cov_85.895888_5_plen_480_part_00
MRAASAQSHLVVVAWSLSVLLQIAAVPIVGKAEEAVQEVVVTVPEGAVVGQKLRFEAPGGGTYYEIAVPPGATAGTELRVSVPAPPPPPPLPPAPPPPPPPPEEAVLNDNPEAVPSQIGLYDPNEKTGVASSAAPADDPAEPAATGLIQPSSEKATNDGGSSSYATAAQADAAAAAGEAVALGLGPARDHPPPAAEVAAGGEDIGDTPTDDAPIAAVDRVGAKHYRVLAVPHCGTRTDAPAAQFRARERVPARQLSVMRFCWDETHLQLTSAVLSDRDIVGRGRQRCAATASAFDSGDLIKLSLSSGADTPTQWVTLSISAAGGMAMSRVTGGSTGEQSFDCTGSGTHVSESRVVTSVMIGGNEEDAGTMYGIDEAAASRHVMDITVENQTDSAGSLSGWRVTARLPWRLLQGGGGLFPGDEPAQGTLVSANMQLSPTNRSPRLQSALEVGRCRRCLPAGSEMACEFLSNRHWQDCRRG